MMGRRCRHLFIVRCEDVKGEVRAVVVDMLPQSGCAMVDGVSDGIDDGLGFG